MKITASELNAWVEFDAPFHVSATGDVHPHAGIYAPDVEHDDKHDMLIDGRDYRDAAEWEAFSGGYTGQHGYSGPTMHASETLSGGLAEDILSTPGVYVVTTVDVDCMGSESFCTYDNGCDCEPAGWAVLKLKDN